MFKRTAVAVLALAASARAEKCYRGNKGIDDIIHATEKLIDKAGPVAHPEKVAAELEQKVRDAIATTQKGLDKKDTITWADKDAILQTAYISCRVYNNVLKNNENYRKAPQAAKDDCIGAYNDFRDFLSNDVIGKDVKPALDDKDQAIADQCEEDVRDACEIEGFPGWAIFLIVVGGIIVLAVLIGIIFACCCNGKGGDQDDDDDA